jgi:hypothetical protein
MTPMNLGEIYMRASENHLKRVEVLQGVEWKVAFALWAAIGLATSTALLNMEKISALLFSYQTQLAFAYLAVAFSYLLGFCSSNYNSLVTERKRYQHFQDLACHASQAPVGIRISPTAVTGTPLSEDQEAQLQSLIGFNMLGSKTWFFKVISTHVALLLSYLSLAMTAMAIEAKEQAYSLPCCGTLIIVVSFFFFAFLHFYSKK